jgi:hypothetical protein
MKLDFSLEPLLAWTMFSAGRVYTLNAPGLMDYAAIYLADDEIF